MATVFMNINSKRHVGQRISSRFYAQKQENISRISGLSTLISANAEAGPQSKDIKQLYSFLANNL
jgi:hypothetical protein